MTSNLFFWLLLVWIFLIILLTIRGTVPRYKTDVLINIIWKWLLPILLINILILLIFLSLNVKLF